LDFNFRSLNKSLNDHQPFQTIFITTMTHPLLDMISASSKSLWLQFIILILIDWESWLQMIMVKLKNY